VAPRDEWRPSHNDAHRSNSDPPSFNAYCPIRLAQNVFGHLDLCNLPSLRLGRVPLCQPTTKNVMSAAHFSNGPTRRRKRMLVCERSGRKHHRSSTPPDATTRLRHHSYQRTSLVGAHRPHRKSTLPNLSPVHRVWHRVVPGPPRRLHSLASPGTPSVRHHDKTGSGVTPTDEGSPSGGGGERSEASGDEAADFASWDDSLASARGHQPRERSVPCSGCGRPTWEFHAWCDACGLHFCRLCKPHTLP
jgi:hypothetical protein